MSENTENTENNEKKVPITVEKAKSGSGIWVAVIMVGLIGLIIVIDMIKSSKG